MAETDNRRRRAALLCIMLPALLWAGMAAAAKDARFADQRRNMVKEQIEKRGVTDAGVLAAMRSVPRHRFVPDNLENRAYNDSPLPIGHGQTISQPYIVAYMTEMLQVDGDSVVFEVGTGSGYQAAVLAELVKSVYSMEIIEPLADTAAERLQELGYDNVHVKNADGYYGWPENAPFDAIIVTAAAGHIPPPLIEQLKAGGRMVIPVGGSFMVQNLVLVTKDAEGKVGTRTLLPVRFVPLTGTH